MAEALTIHLEEDLARRLDERAKKRGASVEEEIRIILRDALQRDWDRFWQQTEQIRKTLAGKRFGDSTELIREDRER
jgi:plasmid stability protein